MPYAHSLHLRGVPLKTVSCRDTRRLYYFSPDHEERHQRRLMMCGSHWTDPQKLKGVKTGPRRHI